MLNILFRLSHQRIYWILLILLGLAFESAALFYQYVLDELPCVLCIHIRIWIAGFILLGLASLVLNNNILKNRIFHFLNILVMAGFVESSWQTLAVERGWTFGACDMESGLPNWFALDKWMPSLFEVQTSCGYTPYIVFEISMAEVLMATSSTLLFAAMLLFAASLSSYKSVTSPSL